MQSYLIKIKWMEHEMKVAIITGWIENNGEIHATACIILQCAAKFVKTGYKVSWLGEMFINMMQGDAIMKNSWYVDKE